MKQIRDSEIEQSVLKELYSEKRIDSKELCIFVCDGVATLKGSVRTRKIRLAAETAAERAKGVVAVMNEIRIRPSRVGIKEPSILVPRITAPADRPASITPAA